MNEKAKIALICTGSRCADENVPLRIQAFLQEQYQLAVYYREDQWQRLKPKDRARIFLDYVLNDEIEVIWATRGGEGTLDLLPYLELQQAAIRRARPKLLLGFSDFTCLLVYFSQKFNWPTAHAAASLQLLEQAVDVSSAQTVIELVRSRGRTVMEIPGLEPLNSAASARAVIEARVTGGCLSLLTLSMKDVWEIETAGKILVIEDVNEKPHKIARNLKYLRRIGKFNAVAGLILGHFYPEPAGMVNSAAIEHVDEKSLRWFDDFLKVFAEDFSFPVFKTHRIGHGKTNFPVIFNSKAQLITGGQGVLRTKVSDEAVLKEPV